MFDDSGHWPFVDDPEADRTGRDPVPARAGHLNLLERTPFMTTATANRQIRLRQRPDGRIDEPHVRDRRGGAARAGAGPGAGAEPATCRSIPTNRAWIGEEPTYLPPVGIGEVMRAVGLGRVLASNSDDYPEGALVTGLVGWQEYTLAGGRGNSADRRARAGAADRVHARRARNHGHHGLVRDRGDRPAAGGRDDGRLGGGRGGRLGRRPAREAAGRARRRDRGRRRQVRLAGGRARASTRRWTATTRDGASSCERRARTASTSTSRTSAGRSWTRSSRC